MIAEGTWLATGADLPARCTFKPDRQISVGVLLLPESHQQSHGSPGIYVSLCLMRHVRVARNLACRPGHKLGCQARVKVSDPSVELSPTSRAKLTDAPAAVCTKPASVSASVRISWAVATKPLAYRFAHVGSDSAEARPGGERRSLAPSAHPVCGALVGLSTPCTALTPQVALFWIKDAAYEPQRPAAKKNSKRLYHLQMGRGNPWYKYVVLRIENPDAIR
jgi:hypothetical protein